MGFFSFRHLEWEANSCRKLFQQSEFEESLFFQCMFLVWFGLAYPIDTYTGHEWVHCYKLGNAILTWNNNLSPTSNEKCIFKFWAEFGFGLLSNHCCACVCEFDTLNQKEWSSSVGNNGSRIMDTISFLYSIAWQDLIHRSI